ncbi:hypothetical protein QUF74_16155 [Candidatus Halobeggiatoa sp. HSG11]|nr:hypothetical protein [Candidatus Halobeggiatoa sp. HSG11]
MTESIIHSNTWDEGNAGQVLITAKNNINSEKARITSDTWSKGNAGQIFIKANDIFLTEDSIYSDTWGEGNAGQVLIMAKNDINVEGGYISSETWGKGDANQVSIQASNIFLNKENIVSSSAFEEGDAGQVSIQASSISLNEGSRISSSAFKEGNAGQVSIEANDISLTGSRILNGTLGKGNGGDIEIKTKNLTIENGGSINVGSIADSDEESGKGGNIIIYVSNQVKLSAVNLHGEDSYGFGSGIYARSIGKKAGDGGSIKLSADSLIIENGAVIETSTDSTAPAGNINIQINGTVQISGDSSQIELKELSDSHEQYLKDFSPLIYNQSTSGIYSNSNSSSEQSGPGGNIELAAQNLVMTNKGTISTNSAGGGQAGKIKLTVDQLRLDNTAKIASESKLTNTFDKKPDQFLLTGDIVEITDDDGKIGTKFSLNDEFVIFAPPVYTVANLAELDKLKEQYNNLTGGQVVEVEDIGHGQSARFIYGETSFYDFDSGKTVKIDEWFQIKKQTPVTLKDYEELFEINFEYDLDIM